MTCEEHEGAVFDKEVKEVTATANKHFEERKGPWLLDKIDWILGLIPSGGEFDPGEGDSLRDSINKQARITEIEEGTQRAAQKRDQRIKENCKKP